MRLAVSGTHRVGKTTLGQRLAELLPDHEFLDEPYHELVGEGRVFSDPPGVEDFEDQLSYSISSLEEPEENLIFDRCPVDFLAYLIALEGDAAEVLERWGEEVRAAMGSLDGVILVPVEAPDRVEMAPDLDGAVDREAVDEIVRDLLLNDPLELDVQVVEVRGSVSARARAVLDWLGGVVEVLESGSTDTHRPMNNKKNIHLGLSDHERTGMRKHRIRKADVLRHSADELAALLDVPVTRAEEIRALADFQRIPSIGIELARDLIYLGYTSLDELNGTSGAELTDEYERRKGYRTDPCVEDQFRPVVDFARNGDNTKRWWDFTAERKAYRARVGYPQDRPEVNWTEVLRPKGGSG